MNEVELFLEVIKGQAVVALQVPDDMVEKVMDDFHRYDTVMPILDPTSWIENHEQVQENAELVLAWYRFRQVAAKAVEKAKEGAHESNATAP